MRLIHRHTWLWAIFGLLVTIGLAALVVLSLTALRLERAEATARHAAAVEENLRLALWRIDTAWAPLVAQEAVRPVAGYTSGQHDHGAEAGGGEQLGNSAAGAHEPLASPAQPLADTHPDTAGADTTGGDTAGATGELAPPYLAILTRFEWSPTLDHGRKRPDTPADELAAAIDYHALWQRLPAGSAVTTAGASAWLVDTEVASKRTPLSRSFTEFQQRNQAFLTNNALMQQVQTGNRAAAAASEPDPPPLVALWEAGQMLLVRRATHRGQEVLQGCVLDWDQVRQWSLELIADLLPAASLEPVQRPAAAADLNLPAGRALQGGPDLLAALPVRLIPGPLTTVAPPQRLPVPLTLAVAWTGVLLAGALGAVLLSGVMQLSERRAAFVSAVTHELRTPLTTFQLYTEMLCAGMVPDEATRQAYLQTLQAEALRLNHLVDNVLAYARLERRRPLGPAQPQPLEAVIGGIAPRLEQLAQRSEMLLVVQSSAAFATPVRINTWIVEQILLNLIDNACKYAAGAEDRRIVVSATNVKGAVELRVRDHGPGLPGGGRWPRPFTKTAQQAAESAPGLGLGLALSRRLARQIGGSLRCDTAAAGACLVLRLPTAAEHR